MTTDHVWPEHLIDEVRSAGWWVVVNLRWQKGGGGVGLPPKNF